MIVEENIIINDIIIFIKNNKKGDAYRKRIKS